MRKFGSCCISVVFVALVSSAVYAENSVSITPPPIASPTFEKDKFEGKARFTYLSMSGNGMDFQGGGVDIIGRKAFSDNFAGDMQAGLFVMGGDVITAITGTESKSSSTFMNLLYGVNGEYQAYKGETFSALLFAGPNVNFLFGSQEYTYTMMGDTYTDTTTITGYLFGVQGGIQFGIKAGDFHIDPFAMIISQQGSMSISNSYASETVTIDPFVTTSFGLDITYIPWNLSFSAILQEAAKQSSDDKEGVKTNIYQMSWHF